MNTPRGIREVMAESLYFSRFGPSDSFSPSLLSACYTEVDNQLAALAAEGLTICREDPTAWRAALVVHKFVPVLEHTPRENKR